MTEGESRTTPDVPLRALRLLVALASTGSIGGAARELGVSQPAVSATLRSLESTTGMRLVERSPRGSRLTDAGARLADAARDVLAEMGRFHAVVAETRGQQPTLRVAASLTIAEYLLPHWLGPSPRVALAVGNSDTVMAQVRGGLAEIGFVEGASIDPRLRHVGVGADRLVVVVGRGHPWTAAEVGLDALMAAALVVREPGSGTREVLEDALATHGLALPSGVVTLGSTEAIKSMVRRGDTVGVVSEHAVADEARRGDLVIVEVAGLDLTRTLRAVWRARGTLSAEASSLIARARSAGGHEP